MAKWGGGSDSRPVRGWTSEDDNLDPVRLRLPRWRSLLRHTLVAVLLALAAGALFIEPPGTGATSTDCRGGEHPGNSASPSKPPAVKTPDDFPKGNGGAADSDLAVPTGKIGVPIQLAEPATAKVVRPGDHVDVLARASLPDGGDAVLVTNALVLSVNVGADGSPGDGVVYLAVEEEHAQDLARTAPQVALGITVQPR